jgi:hypothetical protein
VVVRTIEHVMTGSDDDAGVCRCVGVAAAQVHGV